MSMVRIVCSTDQRCEAKRRHSGSERMIADRVTDTLKTGGRAGPGRAPVGHAGRPLQSRRPPPPPPPAAVEQSDDVQTASRSNDQSQSATDSGTFRNRLLFSGLRRFVYLVRMAAGRQRDLVVPSSLGCSNHRHRIDKYLDTLLANQPSRTVKPPIAAKICAARWRTARVNSSPILPNQSQRSSFAVIDYA